MTGLDVSYVDPGGSVGLPTVVTTHAFVMVTSAAMRSLVAKWSMI